MIGSLLISHSMGNYTLRAVGEHAKQLKFKHGTCDLLLWTEGPSILLGRAVKDGEGYKYPNTWNSLSSRHCILSFEEASTPAVCGRHHQVCLC